MRASQKFKNKIKEEIRAINFLHASTQMYRDNPNQEEKGLKMTKNFKDIPCVGVGRHITKMLEGPKAVTEATQPWQSPTDIY